MAENIIKLRVDSEEYEGKIKRAAQGLQALGQNLRSAGKTFADADKDAVKFAKELGNMQTVSNTARGKISELSAAFVNLKSDYLKMTDAEKQSPIGQAMAKSLEELKNRTIDAKRELEDLNKELNTMKTTETSSGGGGGGLFSSDKLSGALQVFAGNMMTKAAGAVANLGSEMYDMVQQGIELAKQGEGIRNAFDRLGRGDILDGLRQATHGTVTDLELMKAAVKFNDFKLPVEELGTMLAFAQQKAKDTGQSVDYMVDSIVTGLGRKSLMILDNLGLSATEVKEKMAETGDMTKAVGAIIREQMAKAGDYVETAADRAAQANVSLQNKMEELGRKFAPLEEASNNFWTSMKIGILDVIGGPLTNLLNRLTEAGRLMNAYGQIGGSGKVGRMTQNLSNAREENRESIYQQQQAKIWDYINRRENYMKDRQRWVNGGGQNEDLRQSLIAQAKSFGTSNVNDIKAQIDAAKKMLADYQQAAKQILNPVKADIDTKGLGGSTSTKKGTVGAPEGSIEAQTKKVQDLQKAWRAAADDTSREEIKKQIDEAQFALDKMLGKVKDRPKMEAVEMKLPEGGIGSLVQDTRTRQENGLAVLKQKIKLEIDQEALKADTNTLQTILKDSIQNGITGMDFQLMGLGDQIAKGVNVPDETWQKILDQYNELREKMGQDPIKINFETGGMENVNNGVDDLKKTISTTAKVVGTIGQAFNAIEDPAAKVAAVVAQAIANIALAYSDAMAKDQTTKFNIWSFIAASAASMISMGTAIAQIHSSTGYANGGIVEGNTYSNDQIPIMANAGEVVLNHAQQNALAADLQNGGGRSIQVHGVLRGKDIFIAAENWSKSVGKGELVTW